MLLDSQIPGGTGRTAVSGLNHSKSLLTQGLSRVSISVSCFLPVTVGEGKAHYLILLLQNPKLDQIRKVEEMIKYANSKGITVWIHAWWSREGINKSIGEDNIIRWWKYVIHRLHAYNVIWVIAGEYNMNNYGGFPLEFWNRLGKIIKDEDPYERISGAHPTPPMWSGGADAPQWSTAETVHSQPWLDYNQSQTGHARWCNELIPWIITNAYNKQPAKPVVVTGPWYQFLKGIRLQWISASSLERCIVRSSRTLLRRRTYMEGSSA